MSVTYKLSFASTATERGLFSSPTPVPRWPIIWTWLKIVLSIGPLFEEFDGEQPETIKTKVSVKSVLRQVLRDKQSNFQSNSGTSANRSKVRHKALTWAL